ncbi:MAG: hypothetical protein IK016_11410 [Lachnospiraceae bacterium]|nr:hypothetical protein [Lachnospiraceae bacterium]
MQFIQKTKRLFPLLILMLLLTACRQEGVERLEQYHADMSSFFNNISAYHNSINAIEQGADAAEASAELLRLMDGLQQEFSSLRNVPIPSEYTAIADLMLDAADSMEEAARLYHEAYDEDYRPVKAEQARIYYNRANRCIQVILQVLRGEEPYGEDLIIR